MENRGLIFIPDISGFTKFVNETEIEHSRLIIQELLEILINANQIGLEVSEIEGDAILFYKFGDPPQMEEIYHQVETMFRAFHQNLSVYDRNKYCQCRACLSAIDLTLKIITHYGEFTGYKVKQFHKLIGKDIIVAHQLLKNDIDKHEYWLVTGKLISDNAPVTFQQWMEWMSSVKETEAGSIPFFYTQLSELKNNLQFETPALQDLGKGYKLFSVSEEYGTDIIMLFHACGDMSFRDRWRTGVKKVEDVNHFLPRVGMRCREIREDGSELIISTGYTFDTEKIEFTETEQSSGNFTHYTLEKISDERSRLTMDYYINKSFPGKLYHQVFRKGSMKAEQKKSMENLHSLAQEISGRG